MGIEPPAISPSSSANSLSIPFPVWSNLKKLSAFAGSPCWPHEPTSIWLPPSYLSLVTCSPWWLGIINAFQSSVCLTFRLAPLFLLGKHLFLVIALCYYHNTEDITSWFYPVGFAGVYSNVYPSYVEHPWASVPGLLTFSLYMSHMQSHSKAWLYFITYSHSPKLSLEFQANLANIPKAASTWKAYSLLK